MSDLTYNNFQGLDSKLSDEVIEMMNKVVDMSIEYLNQNRDRNHPVVEFKTPTELEKIIHFGIDAKGTGFQDIMKDLQNTIKYSVRTGHVRFFNQLWAGTDLPALLGEWLTAVMNGSMYTYEVSPVFSIMEVKLLEKLRSLIGWTSGDGAFAPGGAHCNLLAILAARNSAVPNIRKEGVHAPMVCFTSVQDHYTIQRAAGVIGIGENNCIKVPCDAQGRMIPSELEAAILKAKSEGKLPFFINATAGTTVLGAFDPLPEIADIAHKYKIWAHVDACWGGYVLLSKKYRHLVNGIDKFDSVAWTATKCLGLPQQCAAVVMRESHMLNKCNAMGKDYLFHEHPEKEWDLGDKTLNCGRRVDAFKLWLSWKVVGDDGFEARVNHAFEQAQYVTQQLISRKSQYKMLLENPQSLNICYWYIPPSARSMVEGPEKEKRIDEATITIRKRMQMQGKLLVNYSDLPGEAAHFFRLITCNPGAGRKDMDFILDEIDRLGSDL